MIEEAQIYVTYLELASFILVSEEHCHSSTSRSCRFLLHNQCDTNIRSSVHSRLPVFLLFWAIFLLFSSSPSPTRSFSWKCLQFELRKMCYLALALGLLSQENTFAALPDIIFHRRPGGRIVLCCYLYSLPISQVCVYRVSSITILCLLQCKITHFRRTSDE